MKRIYTYMRVSTDTQAKNGDSLEDQQAALRRWAQENDCVILHEYVDAGRSASKEYRTRPAFCQMIEDSKHDRPDMVCFTRLDRFTRNSRDYHNLEYDFRKHGLEWKAIWQKFDTTTQEGRTMISMMMILYESESANTSARIRAHNVEKRARGELTSGKMPRGYIVQDKKPVKDPVLSEGINALFQSYLSGHSVKEATVDANEHGANIISIRSSRYILDNAMAYTGTIQGISCEPYISIEDAELILSRKGIYNRKKTHSYLFGQMLICGICGKRLAGHARANATYYNCTNHYLYFDRCSNAANVSEKKLEDYLLTNLDRLLEESNAKAYEQMKASRKNDAEKKLKNLNNKKQRLIDAYMDGIIDKENLSSRLQSLDDEIESLSNYAPAHIPKVITMPEGWQDTYKQLDMENQAEFWLRALRHITVMPDKSVEVSFR